MRTRTSTLHASLFFALLLRPFDTRPATVHLPVAADTFILSRAPDNNAGGSTLLNIGTDGQGGVRRGLLRFDLSAIPAGATITFAVLRLTVVRIPFGGPMDSNFDLHRLLADWSVGVQAGNSGALAVEGEVTWNSRLHGVGVWTEPGAAGDIEATPSASTFVNSVGGATYEWAGAGVIRDVQDWLNEPGLNFGWLLRSDHEGSLRTARAFAALEYGGSFGTLEISFAPRSNRPPTVAITSPTNGVVLTNHTITITAAAADTDGSVASVRFFDGAVLLGSDNSAPYFINIVLTNGSHTLTAVATDNGGAAATSAPVVILHSLPPLLKLTRSSHDIVIEWNGPYTLESTPALPNSAAAIWTTVPGDPPVSLPIHAVSNLFLRCVFRW